MHQNAKMTVTVVKLEENVAQIYAINAHVQNRTNLKIPDQDQVELLDQISREVHQAKVLRRNLKKKNYNNPFSLRWWV